MHRIRQDDAKLSNVVIFINIIKHRASLDVPSQVFISAEKVSSFAQSHAVQVGATFFLSKQQHIWGGLNETEDLAPPSSQRMG